MNVRSVHRLCLGGWLYVAAALALAAPPAPPPAPPSAAPADTTPVDPGWPRVYAQGGREVVVHQPQIDAWDDWARLRLRAAIAVTEKQGASPRYGVLEGEAATEVDKDSRTVLLRDLKLTPRFAQATPEEAARLAAVVGEALPAQQSLIVSLDRLLPALDAKQVEQREVQVNLDPPLIFHSPRPATLLGFYGAPEFKPVGDSGLQAAINTAATVLLDPAGGPAYYLLLGESWLTTHSLRDGPWTQPAAMPAAFARLPDEGWRELKQAGTGKRLAETPAVFYAEAPAELLITRGGPVYRPIRGTQLQAVTNTESALFLHAGERRHYLLIAGRWFRSASLAGPWSAATGTLPADFAKIPDNDAMAWVLASVPGTEAAADAVLLASVPQKATLQTADLKFTADYAGEPRFRPVEGSDGVRYAVNAADPVLAYADRYYAVKDGVWFEAAAPGGPWQVCTKVPPALYTIPAGSPVHNVTYVTVYDSTPTTVTTGYTAGYTGQYVMNGLLLFGAGMAIGYALNDHDDDWYAPWYRRPYGSYGYGAVYRPGYGYTAAGWARGPYAAAAGRTWYNPATGGWARGGAVATPYGIAGGRAGYNPHTDTYGARIGGANAYGSWGRSYAERDGAWAAAGHRSGPRGNTAWVQTSGGGKAVARNGNLYAGKDGEVYRRTGRGDWQQYSGGERWQASAGARTATGPTGAARATSRETPRTTARAPERTTTRTTTRETTREVTRDPARTTGRSDARPATRDTAASRPATRPEPPRRADTLPERSPDATATRESRRSVERTSTRPATRPATPATREVAAPAGLQHDFSARTRGERSVARSQPRATERSFGGGARSGGGGGGGGRRR